MTDNVLRPGTALEAAARLLEDLGFAREHDVQCSAPEAAERVVRAFLDARLAELSDEEDSIVYRNYAPYDSLRSALLGDTTP